MGYGFGRRVAIQLQNIFFENFACSILFNLIPNMHLIGIVIITTFLFIFVSTHQNL